MSKSTVTIIQGVPLSSSKQVFDRLASTFSGQRLERIPDGETSERGNFTAWQYNTLFNAGKPHLVMNPMDPKDARSFTEEEVRNEMVDSPKLETK